jgi:hypothetical protein
MTLSAICSLSRCEIVKSIAITSVINTVSGFGQTSCEMIAGLTRRGWNVQVKPIRSEEAWRGYPAHIPLFIKERYTDRPTANVELLLSPLDRPNIPSPNKRTVYFTMFETTRLSPSQVSIINRAEAVIVPGKWLKRVFENSGITKPIHIVHLGIHPEIFVETPVPQIPVCVFGAGGCMSASAQRKRLDIVIEAFELAFDVMPDAELRIKLLPGEALEHSDKRIRVNAELMSWCSLVRWFQGLQCFVNIGMEGHGLMVHQAMACGRPCMVLNFGGVTEFFTKSCGYPIDPVIKWCRFGDKSVGAIGIADKRQIRDEMRRVYYDRKEAAEKGKAAAVRAREFTWVQTVDELEKVLEAYV